MLPAIMMRLLIAYLNAIIDKSQSKTEIDINTIFYNNIPVPRTHKYLDACAEIAERKERTRTEYKKALIHYDTISELFEHMSFDITFAGADNRHVFAVHYNKGNKGNKPFSMCIASEQVGSTPSGIVATKINGYLQDRDDLAEHANIEATLVNLYNQIYPLLHNGAHSRCVAI